VLITHDEALAREANRVIRLRAGAIESDSGAQTLQRSA
jgi:predicted ABC-type transport system involved in lysophospholipase L1 biosynthesis ATPase subunit